MKRVFMFPGQGSQYIGMGKEFYDTMPEVQAVFELANEVTGMDIAALCFEENDNIISKIYEAINKIAKKEGFAKEGFRVINNCGENAGQTVMHMHFHIIAGKKLGEGIV